ncbi:MAG TPA: copper-binding protein [Bryobacteraceae bacterium]|nr:copper-binding protein [Bryobacteraceae bacterium]
MSSAPLFATLRRVAAASVLVAALAFPAQKKPLPFWGRVEGIDLKMSTVAIRHGDIPGFMPAMTMDYPIDDRSMLRRLSPGDEIRATVYVGDPTLHDVHVTVHSVGIRH